MKQSKDCSREDTVVGCAEKRNLTSRVGSEKIMCRHRKQTCGCQAGARYKREGWEFVISRCKLLYIDWINNKVQPYKIGNYLQYAMINHNGKEYFLKCIWITEPLCYTAETNIANQLYLIFLKNLRDIKCKNEKLWYKYAIGKFKD